MPPRSLTRVDAHTAGTRLGRQSARAILIDELGRLVLFKRTKAGVAPYWTTPGGRLEDTDASLVAALHRELKEELGAEAIGLSRVFLHSRVGETGLAIQHFYLARLTTMDLSARSGPEFDDPSRGTYDVERVSLRGDDLRAVNLRPEELKAFILTNRIALLGEVGLT